MKPVKGFLLAPALFLFASVFSVLAASDFLRGKAFTNPEDLFPMPGEWAEQPIEYEPWAKGADIAVSIEQDVYQLLLPFIEEYERQTGFRIAGTEGTCSISTGMFLRKKIDMGGYCCPPGRDDRLPGMKFHTLGIVGIAFLVNQDNPIEGVTSDELRRIFMGQIYRWSELKTPGGRPGPDWIIRTVGRFHCTSRPGHWRLLLGDEDLFSQRVFEVGSITDMVRIVAGQRAAIGWEVPGMVEKYEGLGRVKALKIDGISSNDPDAIASLKYPYYRVYGITTWTQEAARSRKAEELAAYLMKAAEKIDARRYGFVPASRLRKAGWKFKGDELIGEPDIK